MARIKLLIVVKENSTQLERDPSAAEFKGKSDFSGRIPQKDFTNSEKIFREIFGMNQVKH